MEKKLLKFWKNKVGQYIRSAGSHHRMGKGPLRTTVPVHGNRDIGKGLLAEIERQTGVKLK